MAPGSRRWLLKAGVNRPEVHTSTRTTRPIRFHDLRATGITWMAVRGDDPLKIMQRAGHTSFATTQLYVRTAEAIRQGFHARSPLGQLLHHLRGGQDSNPAEASTETAPNVANQAGHDESRATREDETRRAEPEPIAAVDAVDTALADALTAATTAGLWDVVAQLASELEARRVARRERGRPCARVASRWGAR
jgi:hypothetical protein